MNRVDSCIDLFTDEFLQSKTSQSSNVSTLKRIAYMTGICCKECNTVMGRKYEAVGGDDDGWSERNEVAKLVRNL